MPRFAEKSPAHRPLPLGEGRGEGALNHHCAAGAEPRRAFTLVELLVVIAIIGMLTAIAVPTIFTAVASARNAKTKAELDLLHMAIMNYKNEYGSFPPANFGPVPGIVPPIALDNADTYTRHPVYRHLVRVFPRIAEARAAYAELATLSPAQALVFWLQGFYENTEYPLTNQGRPGNRKKMFEFEESRLYAASAYSPGSQQTFTVRTPATNKYPVYFTGHASCGLPYVYFDSRCYDDAPASDIAYRAQSRNGNASIASPYLNAVPTPSPTWAQHHMASDTFQIIAAGRDDSYGQVQAAFPTEQPVTKTYTANNGKTMNAGPYPPVTNTSTAAGHADNLTNFAERPLADAVEALKSQ